MFTDERNMFNDERNMFNDLDSLIIDEGRVGENDFSIEHQNSDINDGFRGEYACGAATGMPRNITRINIEFNLIWIPTIS